MATYKNDSFVKKTNLIDGTFLDVNNLPRVPQSIYDEEFIITEEFNQRPDLLSFKLYNTSRLWWVFTMRNLDKLHDPIRDFKPGLKIKLPSPDMVANLYSR